MSPFPRTTGTNPFPVTPAQAGPASAAGGAKEGAAGAAHKKIVRRRPQKERILGPPFVQGDLS